MGMVIGVALEVLSASSYPGTVTLQRTFEEAILCFIFGPPELEGKALRKVKEIIDFALKYKLLGDLTPMISRPRAGGFIDREFFGDEILSARAVRIRSLRWA